MVRLLITWGMAATLAGCGGFGLSQRDEVEGNISGGFIPPSLAAGGNAQSRASAHCAKYNRTARITFDQSQTGGEVVFVCEPAGTRPPQEKAAAG